MPPFPIIAAALLVLCAAACKREETVEIAPATTPPAIDAGATPADHLGEGELLEGTDKAFGLVLPRRVKVDHAFVDMVFASGDARPDAVANYIRARVRSGAVRIGAANTLFEKVQIPANPGREYSIRVASGEMGQGCVIELRDVTPPPPLQGSEEDKWRAVGMSPDGR